MENKTENEMETLGPFKRAYSGFEGYYTPTMGNQMEMKMENKMERRGGYYFEFAGNRGKEKKKETTVLGSGLRV